MHNLGIQDILVNVEKPSRYLGTEVNRVLKDPAAVDLHMALAFPDLYEIGTSHFGIQILYHLLNQRPNIYVERVFAPAADMDRILREKDRALPSLETQTPLNRFHIVGFSLLYELNFTNVLNMMDLAHIPLYAHERDEAHPIVIAGGPCVSNPEPMAPFFDAMVFGDGETVLPRMAEQWLSWQKEDGKDRKALLRRWSKLEGVYIPSFFKVRYDESGLQHLEPLYSDYTAVSRAVVEDLDNTFFPDHPTIPFGKPIHDRLRLEISRGCSRGCRFCQAGMIYRPVRERSPRRLLELTEKSLTATGYEDLSLLSLSTGDYTCLVPLMEILMQRCRSERVAVSLPSIRAGTLTPGLMTLIKKVRKTGFTIAPEAGSQRLRDVINKNVYFEDIADTVRDAFNLGWKTIKLYFMIGLPTETQDDLEAIVQMVKELKKIKGPSHRQGTIHVSVTTFIPKGHTPFQWATQISLDESWEKIEFLKSRLHQPGIQVKWQNPNMSLFEGVIARGDRRVAAVIEKAWRSGCTFDGWSDQFNVHRWLQACEQTGVTPEFFTTRKRSVDERLPWDHMDVKISRQFLKDQLADALEGKTVQDCRHGKCHQCGICDFKTIRPRVFDSIPEDAASSPSPDLAPEQAIQLEVMYTKLNQARFFGHLEVAGIFARAFRRAKIQVLFSQGFHPMPRISFDDPIPLGMESQGERFRVKVAPHLSCEDVAAALNHHLPDGITVVQCRRLRAKKDRIAIAAERYLIYIDEDLISSERIGIFHSSDNWPYTRISHKGRTRQMDLKNDVIRFEKSQTGTLYLEVRADTSFTVRPADLLQSVLQIDPAVPDIVRVTKLMPVEYGGDIEAAS